MSAGYCPTAVAIANRIKPHVQFSPDKAHNVVLLHRQQSGSALQREMNNLAEHFVENAARYGITELQSRRADYRTKLSMLREAIRYCAEQIVEGAERRMEADRRRRPIGSSIR